MGGGGHKASAEAIRDAFKLEFGDEYRVTFEIRTHLFFFLGFLLPHFCSILHIVEYIHTHTNSNSISLVIWYV